MYQALCWVQGIETDETVKTTSVLKNFRIMEETSTKFHENTAIIMIGGKGIQKEVQNTDWKALKRCYLDWFLQSK